MNVTPALASRICHVQQGSYEWHMVRCARATASDIDKVLAIATRGPNKGGDTEGRRTYKCSKIAEIMTGEPDMEGYVTDAMSRGQNEEPRARAAYEIANDIDVDEVGFVIHPETDRAGCSPDGLVGADGMLEIKNPKSKNHIDYMLSGILPKEYEPQVMFSLACTEREWCDFISFDNRWPNGLRVFSTRVYRDEPRIKYINDQVTRFFEEVDEIVHQLEKRIGQKYVSPVKVPEVLDPNLYLTDDDIPEAWR